MKHRSDFVHRQRPASAGETVRKRHDEAGALMLILNDQHEHLGQSIAYARSNSVVPPWSEQERRSPP
jgi:hypothetical protein